MNTAQSALTIIGLHTKEPKVFWNGKPVEGIVGIHAVNDGVYPKVALKFNEDPMLAEMAAAGIKIVRV